MAVIDALSHETRLDGRTRLARRRKALQQAIAAELSVEPSPLLAKKIERAAEMLVLADQLRGLRLAGCADVEVDDVVRMDNAARRALLDLGLPSGGARPAESIDDL